MMILNKKTSTLLRFLCCLLFVQTSFGQFTIPEIPKNQTSVYDYASVLSVEEKNALEQKLVQYSDSTSTQIVVITIETLKGEDIGILTPKWGHAWGIGGSKENDNGVIILVAKAERKIWISAGYGLEDRLTAGIGGEITRNAIVPEFKAGSYYKGLDKGVDEIFKVFKGKYKGERKKNSDKKQFPVGLIFLIIIIVIFIVSKKGNGGIGGGMPSLLDVIVLSSLGRNSGGFGSFGGSSDGGGGFGGGFGGGGFSGGGSGGSW